MNLWPFPSSKASRVTRAITLGLGLREAIPPPATFTALATEGYIGNPVIFASVNAIARAIAGLPWVLYARGTSADPAKARKIMHPTMAWKMYHEPSRFPEFRRKALAETEITEHPFLNLLDRPNPDQSQNAFFEAMVCYWLIAGTSFTEIVSPDTGPRAGMPTELWQLRPDRVKILPGTDNESRIGGYTYTVGGAKPVDLTRDQVLQQSFFHPTNDFYGLSPLQVAGRTILSDNEAAKWNHKLLHNDARPSGALTVQGTLGDDEFKRMKAEVAQNTQGAENAGRFLLLEGGAEWQRITLSPSELDYLEGRKFLRVIMAGVAGVPPELVGDAEHKTYNSFPEARASFYQETVLPLADRIKAALNTAIVTRFGDRLLCDYDRDQIEAIQEDRAKAWARLNTARWLTLNEKRTATGYDQFDGDEKADVPEGLLPTATQGAPAAPQGANALTQDGTADLTPDPAQDPPTGPEGAQAKQALTRAQAAKRRAFERALRKHFGEEGAALSGHLKRALDDLVGAS